MICRWYTIAGDAHGAANITLLPRPLLLQAGAKSCMYQTLPGSATRRATQTRKRHHTHSIGCLPRLPATYIPLVCTSQAWDDPQHIMNFSQTHAIPVGFSSNTNNNNTIPRSDKNITPTSAFTLYRDTHVGNSFCFRHTKVRGV
jgi:hypothetical protein